MIYSKLTPEQKAAYLKDSGKCPFCGSKNVQDEETHYERDAHCQNIFCLECGREWVEVYRLVEVADFEQGCDDCNQIIEEGDEVEKGENGGFCHVNCPDDTTNEN